MGEIVSGVATALLEKLATKAYQEIVSACGLEDDIEKLRGTMALISDYLADAENKQVKEKSITNWLQQLQEAFCDANDILDEIECETLRNQEVREYGSAIRKVRRFFSYSNPLAFRLKMSHKIRDIRGRINEIASTRQKLGLNIIDHCRDNHWSLTQMLPWRETHSNLPSRLTGRDEEKEKLVNDLMRPNLEDNKIDVIPIVGIGGVGKTTLAQLVYNDKRVVQNFQKRMWVCVFKEFEIKRLMLEILEAASGIEKAVGGIKKDAQSFSLDRVKTLLLDILYGKKFLLVLDDVWDEDVRKWQQLEDVLLGLVDEGNKDSKIIVTTRSQIVASIMGKDLQHNIQALPQKECLELFFKCAFSKGEEEKHPRIKMIGKEIVEKCQGVPLAVVNLGYLLYSQYDENEWKKIRDNELWELDQSREDSILPALKLNYNELPPQVKQCFSLCSIFPKGYMYHSVELISLWMAHGLLQPSNDREVPEYIGELYIKKLVAISFFMPIFGRYRKTNELAGFVAFKMHDLVHDLALSIMRSKQATINNDSKLVNEKVQHLSFWHNASPIFDHKLNKVRTIISPHRRVDEFVDWICNEFKYLKVLDFQNSDFQFLPRCLGRMKHLTYLCLFSCSNLEKLPNSICKLQNLQFLMLYGCQALKELPKNMGRNLIRLRTFYITAKVTNLSSIDIGCFKCLQCLVIESCENLVSLPQDLRNLSSLKKLVVCNCPKLVSFEDNEDEKKEKKTQVVNNFSLQIFASSRLPKLTALPNWLTRNARKSLLTLYIEDCKELSSLSANMNELESLQHLYIIDCNPELEAKYREGPERIKLPHVRIHFEDHRDAEDFEDEKET